jgi:MauM/NapG family ferredoxin protein
MGQGQTKLIPLRRSVQVISFSALIFIIWNTRFPLEDYISPAAYFYLDPLVMTATAIAERVALFGLIVSAALLALTALLGRFFCGWICPLGALLDCMAMIARPMMRKRAFREARPWQARYVKYGLFGLIMAAAVAGIQVSWIFDPLAIFVRAFSLVIHPLINNGLNGLFALVLQRVEAPALERLFYSLRQGFLTHDFPALANSGEIAFLFTAILVLVAVRRRFWCRYLCPLGGMLALAARLSPLRRETNCGTSCGACSHVCRMNAITPENATIDSECVLCFDCVRDCPVSGAFFAFSAPWRKPGGQRQEIQGPAITRAAAFRVWATTALAMTARAANGAMPAVPQTGEHRPLRPPGSLMEQEFSRRCIRCGNCMKVCPTGVLAPASLSRGVAMLWSPLFDTGRSYCEYDCNLCGRVCPTGAIAPLTMDDKKHFIVGTAVINEDLCVPFKKGIDCIVCEEHCPVPGKAIYIEEVLKKGRAIKMPRVDEKHCIGCGICQIKCPVDGEKAIIIVPAKHRGPTPRRSHHGAGARGGPS